MAEEKSKLIERQYVIPLRKEWLKTPMHKRAKKAILGVRRFLSQHMKVDLKDVKLEKWLNEKIWEHGMKNPTHKVKVNVTKDEKGIVRAQLAELSEKAKKIDAKEKARAEAFSKKKGEKKEEKAKKVEETTKEEITETPEDKAEHEKEKIMHKEMPKTENLHVEKEKHKVTTKPFRQAMQK